MGPEVVPLPVSDADRARNFCVALGTGLTAAAHGRHEKEIGRAGPDWPDWYARYMVGEWDVRVAGG
ncbi:hypothetical protein [Frankia sp. CiP3]|uniref:hypothetical protein n=1 Tax=Frankia sp. CiP3 TaxID=2880971 RepID=UPI001EF694A3|nr:hypothetical protein [Frankia sp. CiP3]